MKYIHQLSLWPRFTWNHLLLADRLTVIHHHQGRLMGRMERLGFTLQAEAVLQTLTEDVLKSSEIEGELLYRGLVRSSLAQHLGIDKGGLKNTDRNVEGVVQMMLDATQNFGTPLSDKRLYQWHSLLFADDGKASQIQVGRWRNDKGGPMQVVSGPVGKTKIHFQAPQAKRLKQEMQKFLSWFNSKEQLDPLLKAGIAHLWFVTIHPFDDGNGRTARAIADMALARSENSPQRFYSMSAQICTERKAYYDILETTQKGGLDITAWLQWFLGCLERAIQGAESALESVLKKARFWEQNSATPFNERQRKIINRLLDGFEGKLTSSKWAALGKCSQDTASRDIDDLMKRKILVKNPGGGRSTSYSLCFLNR